MPLEDTSHSTCSNDGLWGLLTPLDTRLDQQKFKASNATYTVGRELGNDLQLSGNHISKFHCIICWDGQDSNSKITVIDLSMNGTYINGRLVGKHKRALLQHGDVIVFGIRGALDEEPEHRYTYSHMAGHKCITLQDDYKIIGQVGKGTFATVLKARCLSENRLYAIKVLERDVLDPSKSSQGSYTFEREISIMERLIHPNILF
ncbi:Serine/threonine-protein kinase cds1 [Grifola frondosa]|uniref:Serine/threonine-protein kinase cds1 n=1 Tax=Grifola frondosa TaxID=5627 RepID=A0A1C7LM72_GRIFR|nr:Serine/threonine-protein kinase cds1 [Grifola frondosa]